MTVGHAFQEARSVWDDDLAPKAGRSGELLVEGDEARAQSLRKRDVGRVVGGLAILIARKFAYSVQPKVAAPGHLAVSNRDPMCSPLPTAVATIRMR